MRMVGGLLATPKPLARRSFIRRRLGEGGWSVSLPRSGSLVHDLDLLVDHLAGEAIDRHACRAVGRRGDRRRVHPVTQ